MCKNWNKKIIVVYTTDDPISWNIEYTVSQEVGWVLITEMSTRSSGL